MAQSAQSNQQFASASLYVGDLASEVTEAMLYEVFNSVGPVASIRVCRDSVTRRSLGYAYVNFHSVNDAERALDTLNYSSIKGHPCRIMWSHRDPGLRKSAAGNIFVKNLDKNIDNKALYDTFSLFGNILSCKVATDSHGRSFGYGFVHYENEESAKTAIERVNGMQIGEKTVFVGPFVRRKDRGAGETNFSNVYVKHFPESWTDEQLKNCFSQYGAITSAVIMKDNKNRPFGFVNFKDFEAAKASVEALHDKLVKDVDPSAPPAAEGEEDWKLYVGRAQTKAERRNQLRSKFDRAQADRRPHQGVNLYIKNLDDSIDDEKLREAFQQFGTITSAKVMLDDKGASRGFGFVCFMSPDEATKAVTEMHLKLMFGKPLYVGLAEKREARLSRLQQRYRVPNMRPGPMPPHMGFPNAPAPVYFSPGMQGPRPGMMYPQQMGMAGGWRPQVPYPGPRPMGMQQQYPVGMQQPMPAPGYAPRGAGKGKGRGPAGAPGQFGGRGKGGNFQFTAQARNQQSPGAFVQQAPAPGEGSSDPNAPLTAAALAAAPPGLQKQMLGEKLFPLITKFQPELAGKITGMMLEMDNSELLILLDSEAQLKHKVDEALRVLEASG